MSYQSSSVLLKFLKLWFSVSVAQQSTSGLGRQISKVSRSHTHKHTHKHTVGFLWTSGQPVAEAKTIIHVLSGKRTRITTINRPQTYALDHLGTGIRMKLYLLCELCIRWNVRSTPLASLRRPGPLRSNSNGLCFQVLPLRLSQSFPLF
jgi:hypothetical protein